MLRGLFLLSCLAPTGAISRRGDASLRVRGGSFDFDARETADICGIKEPEKEVVNIIRSASSKLVSALGVRGGSFDFDARNAADMCGIEEPEKEVVKTIKTAVTYPIKKVFGIARGGALLDVSARETAEQCEIEECESLVVRTIKAAFDYTAERVLESGVVPDELAKD